jgi:hypothetical protein
MIDMMHLRYVVHLILSNAIPCMPYGFFKGYVHVLKRKPQICNRQAARSGLKIPVSLKDNTQSCVIELIQNFTHSGNSTGGKP